MKKATFIAAALTAGVAGTAVALPSTIQVGVGGGDLGLRAYDFSASVFGGAPQGEFTGTALASIHSVLNAGGITTANWITVVAAFVDTDGVAGADETSLIWLIDDQLVGQGMAMPTTHVSFQSGINKSSGAAAWINDIGDAITVDNNAPGFDKQAFGTFEWDNDNGSFGDAFAWSNLATNDTGNFRFQAISNWTGFEGVQFVSYDATSGNWGVLEQITGTGAFQTFSFTVIPFPPAALIGLAGLAGVGVIRRRIAG
jgi:hypothetical protein